jgi:hypothetical protein
VPIPILPLPLCLCHFYLCFYQFCNLNPHQFENPIYALLRKPNVEIVKLKRILLYRDEITRLIIAIKLLRILLNFEGARSSKELEGKTRLLIRIISDFRFFNVEFLIARSFCVEKKK